MKPYRSRILAAALSVSCALTSTAQPDAAARPLQSILDRAAGRLGAGGIVAADINGGEVRYLTAGKPAAADGIAPESVVFEIGSITKVFTALLFADAVNADLCNLDDPIGKFLPPAAAMAPETAAITLGQLATHTSGLPRLPANFAPEKPADPYADYTVERLHAFLGVVSVASDASKSVDYSNLGTGLLGHVLELIHGKSYASLVAEKITNPLGMSDTLIELGADQQARFATPYSGTQQVSPWTFDVLAGAGAIRSTAADMAKFAKALLSEDPAVATAWRLAREPRADLGNSAGHIGLGFFISTLDGRNIYNHSGGTGGFRSYIELDPQQKRALVILINNDAIEPAGIASLLNSPAPKPDAGREDVPVPAGELARYTGVYEIDARARFTVVIDETGRLRVRLTGQAFLPAFHMGNDRFFLKVVAAEYQFGRSATGEVDSLTLHQNGRQIPAKKTATPAPTVLFPKAEELAAYDGRYQLAPGAIFEIVHHGAVLTVKLTGQPAFPVHNDAPDHFVYDVVEAALTFERDATGAVVAVVLHQNGVERRAPRIP